MIFCAIFLCGCEPSPKPKTVNEYLLQQKKAWNKYVSKPCDITERVNNTHLVEVYNAYVKDVRASTWDGSDLAGDNNENVKNFAVIVVCEWQGDGFVNSSRGSTEVAYLYRVNGEDLEYIDSRISSKDALINTSEPTFWAGVAVLPFLL